jgi:hypothetical protein
LVIARSAAVIVRNVVAMNAADLERIASPAYLHTMNTWALPELRQRRSECQRWEDSVSFARRIIQGRLDIVRHELVRRRAGHARSTLIDLIVQLPDTLADAAGPATQQRASHSMAIEVPTELGEMVDRHSLDGIELMDDAELSVIEADLMTTEKALSDARRTLFDRIDTLSGELAQRYRSGDASVDELLK